MPQEGDAAEVPRDSLPGDATDGEVLRLQDGDILILRFPEDTARQGMYRAVESMISVLDSHGVNVMVVSAKEGEPEIQHLPPEELERLGLRRVDE